MAKSFDLDLTKFIADLKATENDIEEGVKEAMDQIKDDWVMQSRDIAPLDTSNLRRQIHGEVDGGKGMDAQVIVTGNATTTSKGYGRFNYGYWLHEVAPPTTKLSTPGTTLKFFDTVGETREKEWMRWLEEEIEDAAKKRGF